MGNTLRALRKKAGLTQAEAAKKMGLGVSTIAMWETGRRKPRIPLFSVIVKVYGCEIADLFSESE